VRRGAIGHDGHSGDQIGFNFAFCLAFSERTGPVAMRAARLMDGRINDPNPKTNVPPFQGGT
jgi:hypothetical protein